MRLLDVFKWIPLSRTYIQQRPDLHPTNKVHPDCRHFSAQYALQHKRRVILRRARRGFPQSCGQRLQLSQGPSQEKGPFNAVAVIIFLLPLACLVHDFPVKRSTDDCKGQ